MTLIEDVNNGIKEAMRNKDSVRLNTLRMLKSKVSAVDARANLPDVEVIRLFKTYYSNLQEAKEQAHGRQELIEQLDKELSIVQEFLPKTPSYEETKKIVLQAIADSGATTKKDLGIVMKSAMRINSTIDGKLTKEIADALLM